MCSVEGERKKKPSKAGRIAARRPAVRLISKQVPASTEGQKRPKRPQHSSVTEVLHTESFRKRLQRVTLQDRIYFTFIYPLVMLWKHQHKAYPMMSYYNLIVWLTLMSSICFCGKSLFNVAIKITLLQLILSKNTRAIITRGLYTFYLIFEAKKFI
jgi:hypothetical protein